MADKPSKLATALRQGYQGATLGFGDELIDYSVAPIVAALTGQKLSDVVDQARQMSADDLASDTQNSKTALTAQILGGLPSAIASSPKLLAQAGLGAVQGFGSGQGDLNDRLDDAAIGGAFGLGGQAVAKGLNRVSKGASDLISPEVRKTAQKLKSMGIPVRLSQLVDSKFLSAVDMALSKVPFSGAGKSQEAQRKAFTKALSKTFGEDADTITDEVLGNAKGRLSGEYDRLLGNTDIPVDRQAVAQKLSQLVGDLSLETDDAGAEFLSKQANNILNTIDNNGGKLTGKSYQKLRQTLKGASGNNYSVRQIRRFLDDEVRNAVPENIGAGLGQIDSQYRNMKIAEKLYGQQQNASGQFKPETLYNAAKPNISDLAYGGGGELGDLARSGRLLRPTIPDSGTTTQAIGAGALSATGVGAFFDPTIALGALGTIGTARGINSAMNSRYLQEGLSQPLQNAAQGLVNSKAIPTALRNGYAAQNTEQAYDPESDPELQSLLNGYSPDQDPELQNMLNSYNPDNDPELQALLQPQTSMTEIQSTQTLPNVNAPMMVPDLQSRIQQAESGGNPNAKNPNSSASGLYQFTDGTWKGLINNYPEAGLQNYQKNDPKAQQIAMALLTDENTRAYNKAGIQPNDADLYAAHFLGAPSAVKAKLNPQAIGAALFPQAAKSNPTIFYNNGRPRTNAEINRLLGSKVGV